MKVTRERHSDGTLGPLGISTTLEMPAEIFEQLCTDYKTEFPAAITVQFLIYAISRRNGVVTLDLYSSKSPRLE